MSCFKFLAVLAIILTLPGCAGNPQPAATLAATLAVPTAADAAAAPTATEIAAASETAAASATAAAFATAATPATTPDAAVTGTALRVTSAAAQTPVPTETYDPRAWTALPVLPQLSPRAQEILKQGLAKGRNPRAFSKIGDCESQASWFLGDFDLRPKVYSLGSYDAELQPVIDYYSGSYKRLSLAAKPGFSAASLLATIWADKKICEKNESPLACEYRVNKPLVAFIMLGSNDASNPKTFEGHMRKIIEYSLEQGVLPVLGTKADNVEGDHFINATIARLAHEYDLPLWNYWSAVQGLPGKGLQEDGVHLTYGPTRFDTADNMKKAWPVRNLNALQILKVMMEASE